MRIYIKKQFISVACTLCLCLPSIVLASSTDGLDELTIRVINDGEPVLDANDLALPANNTVERHSNVRDENKKTAVGNEGTVHENNDINQQTMHTDATEQQSPGVQVSPETPSAPEPVSAPEAPSIPEPVSTPEAPSIPEPVSAPETPSIPSPQDD